MACKFDVMVLTYGDHPAFIRRCLQSIADNVTRDTFGDDRIDGVRRVHVAMNDPAPSTRRIVSEFEDRLYGVVGYPVVISHQAFAVADGQPVNVGKYPMMRYLLDDGGHAFSGSSAERVMWFDDDSFIRPRSADLVSFWLQAAAASAFHDVNGYPYSTQTTEAWREAVKRQSWYAGQEPLAYVKFITGGFWIAPRQFLRRYDYPFPDLFHNGGDVILGELVRQHNGTFGTFRHEHVGINADLAGAESKAKRRGLSTKRYLEPGYRDHARRDVFFRATSYGKEIDGPPIYDCPCHA